MLNVRVIQTFFFRFSVNHVYEVAFFSIILILFRNLFQSVISLFLFHTFFCIKLRMTNEKHAMLLICHISLDFWVWILNHQSSLPIWILFFNVFFAFLTSQSNRTRKNVCKKFQSAIVLRSEWFMNYTICLVHFLLTKEKNWCRRRNRMN